jgi:hypothetical protein
LRFANRQVDLAAGTSRKLILSDGGTRYAKVSYSASAISSIVLGELIGVNMGSVHTQIRTITAGFHASISSLFFSPGAIISNTNDATRGVQIFFLCNEKQELLVQSTVDDCMLDRGDAIMSVALTPPSSLTRTLALGSLDGIVRLRKATLVAAGMGDTQDRWKAHVFIVPIVPFKAKNQNNTDRSTICVVSFCSAATLIPKPADGVMIRARHRN